MAKDGNQASNARIADFRNAAASAKQDPSTERALDLWDKAAYMLANKDPGYKDIVKVGKSYGASAEDLSGPNPAGAYLTAVATRTNYNTGANGEGAEAIKRREIENGNITPEQHAQAGAILKKYGVSDPDGTLAIGLAYASANESRDGGAHLSMPGNKTAAVRPQSQPAPAGR